MKKVASLLCVVVCGLSLPVQGAPAATGRQVIADNRIAAITAGLAPVERLAGTNGLDLMIALPLRNQAALTKLLDALYDPASPNFHQFLTSAQFTEQFGPSEEDYQALLAFAKANGLTVVQTHANRALLHVRGPVANIERTFHVKMQLYRHPTEARNFYAPDTAPSIDIGIPILDIRGFENYELPHPAFKRRSADKPGRSADDTGSGPTGDFMGNDFRNAYAPGVTLNGAGQTVALFEMDSYYPADITYYENTNGLPNVALTNVLLGGFDGNPADPDAVVEVSLDIEMAIAMAPGLSRVMVYEAPVTSVGAYDILNQMATDNQASQMSSSWVIDRIVATPVPNQIYQQYAVQGQSFFQASGDEDAYEEGTFQTADNPYITTVGGTTLTTTGPGGSYVSEVVWQWGGGTGSGGGISTNFAIPGYQQGIDMSACMGSTNMRNVPDVALTADNVYVRADGQDFDDVGGTSCAAPLWAGFMALVNQRAFINNRTPIGFINPAVYKIGGGPNYSSAFNDTTMGNNTNADNADLFYAVPGYDLCTGWGTPNGGNMITALSGPPDELQISPLMGLTFTGNPGGPFSPPSQVYSLADGGAASLNWSVGNTNSWLSISPMSGTLTPGGTHALVTASLNSVASNLTPGIYIAPVWISNQSDSAVQKLQFTLVVLGAPWISAPPTNLIASIGQAATFGVSAIGATPLQFSWRRNAALIAGATGSNYTTNNVQLADSGSQFSCVVSNNYGSVTSQVAVLTVTASIVKNGGFETGDFSDWTLSGNTLGAYVVADPSIAHSGSYGAALGPVGSLGFMSQTLPTVPGSNYTVSIWAENLEGGANELQVIWNGTSLFDGFYMPAFAWTNMVFSATATGSTSVLEIGFQNDPSFFGLDDISVQLNLPAGPGITSQPLPQTVTPGGSATFTVGATGTGPLRYSWMRNNGLIPGATNATYTTNNVQFADDGSLFSCLVSNAYGAALSSNAMLAVTLVQNGGFELGSFADWTESGNFSDCTVMGGSFYAHSGLYGARLGPSGSLGYLSQTIPTTNGQMYLISCWLDSDGSTPNEFLVSWNGSTLFDGVNLPGNGWTNLQFISKATSTSTMLELGFRDDLGYLGLDDVSVARFSLPQFQTAGQSNGFICLTWATQHALTYQLQYQTNLAATNWINLGSPIAGSNGLVTLTDWIGANHQRFYRLCTMP